VTWADNPNSKVRVLRAIVTTLKELWSLKRAVARGDYELTPPVAVSPARDRP